VPSGSIILLVPLRLHLVSLTLVLPTCTWWDDPGGLQSNCGGDTGGYSEQTDCEVGGDLDDDGHRSMECGGDDCDDHDPSIHPDANEAVWVEDVVWLAPERRSLGGFDAARDDAGGLHVAFVARGPGVEVHYGIRGATWMLDTLEAYGSTDPLPFLTPGLAAEADSTAHVAYGGPRDLMLASGAPGGWTHRPVAESSPGRVSMALDSEGTIHVAWDFGGVWYATVRGDAVDIVQVDPTGRSPSLALSGRSPVVAYVAGLAEQDCVDAEGTAPSLRSARLDAGAWEIDAVCEVVPSDPCDSSLLTPPRIQVDAAGAAHVVFADGRGILATDDRAGDWAVPEIQDPHGDSPAFALDDGGSRHVAYRRDGVLRYARNESIGRELVELSPPLWDIAIVVGVDGEPHVLFDAAGCADWYAGDEESGRSCARWTHALVHASPRPSEDGTDRDCDGEDAVED